MAVPPVGPVRSVCGSGCTVRAIGRLPAFWATAIVTLLVCSVRLEELELTSQSVLQTASETAKGGISILEILLLISPGYWTVVFFVLLVVSIASGVFHGFFMRYRRWYQVLGAGVAVPTTLISLMVVTVKALKFLQPYLTAGP